MGDTAALSASQSSDMLKASMATSAISSIASGISQAKSIQAQGTYQANIATTNAALAKIKASQVLEAGDIAAGHKAAETSGAIGAARAAQGASGTSVGSGSNAIVRSDISTAGALDELTIKNNAARAAWGYQTQSIQDSFQAQFAKLTATSEAQQSIATGGLQAISGPLSIYGTSLRYQRWMGGGGGSGQMMFPWSGSGRSVAGDMGTGATEMSEVNVP